MPEECDIKVENKLKKEKRGVNVYHHSTRSAHIISCDSSIKIPLKAVKKGDYLHISVIRGPGSLRKECYIHLPSWADFEFNSEGKVTVAHSGDRTTLKVPAGPPNWQLKMTCSEAVTNNRSGDYVEVADEDMDR